MSSNKGDEGELNRPLLRLAERLRSLQNEAGEVLDSLRGDNDTVAGRDGPLGGADLASGLESQLGRVGTALLERWDLPTRADLDELHQRIEALEGDLRGRVAELSRRIDALEKADGAKTHKRERRKSTRNAASKGAPRSRKSPTKKS